IIQTRVSRLNKISASARTKNGGRGSLRMRQHPSKVFLVLFVHKENSSSRGNDQPRATPKEAIQLFWRQAERE
ncbi:hypothetical protein, partial [uncultured Rikenella sp.]|uniref:hypothetical protein n=1 Tax=uncultured Rikenella sp. TaxID=368003 RepID=UPI0027120E4E